MSKPESKALDSNASQREKESPTSFSSLSTRRVLASGVPTMSHPPRRAQVLLVEDSEDDAFFFRWTATKAGRPCVVNQIADGGEGIAYLDAVHRGAAPRPDIVFLDLKLPTRTGFEILHWVNQHSFSPALRIVILSGSEHAADLKLAQELGTAAYYVKPISVAQIQSLLDDSCAGHADPALINSTA